MAKAILICGRIASGKSVYAQQLCKQKNAVLLSVDELVLEIFGSDLGKKHDEITGRVQQYLFAKSLEVLNCGSNVILDWGFWTRKKRSEAREYYEKHGVECEFHYVDTPNEVWYRNIESRNRAVMTGKTDAYYVDEGLLKKLETLFDEPLPGEIDVWHTNLWKP